MSGLLTLLVHFGGDELGSGLRVADRAVGGGCVDAPRRLRRCLDARLARSEALSHRLFLACCSASGIVLASRSGCSTGTRSDAVASLCFTLLLLTCSDSDGQDLCPQSVAVFECPMI